MRIQEAAVFLVILVALFAAALWIADVGARGVDAVTGI